MIWGDAGSGGNENDTFVAGRHTKLVMVIDLSPDGAGLSGYTTTNQINDVVFVQVTAASLAAAESVDK